MDDTQQSRVSDASAAATRKRRSSILKSQRPARTPFSELEFNVATPTDTAKSRRVSFSRRTGVAEFVTNEATTTWKNFYEEHNKSLESSSNDSEANASRQPVGHLGKRIFDQQFEEVEAVDFMSGLANGSMNNVNFSQQLASLECTEGKLTTPQNKFELSAFTEQSKPFANDFTAPSLGENSGRIDINFSAIQRVEKDDLDEIEKDLERGSNNIGCHGPFSDRQNMSEYIEIDLNMTRVVMNDEDMSITDTVHSPVQDVSKSASIDKKASLNDWVADKENIAINPYIAPCETNFAVNEEPDQVLVFDGKRLTLQPDIPEKDKNYRQTLLPNASAQTPQRKTIVLNVNDDLPNFVDDMLNSKCENPGFSGFQDIKFNKDENSDTLQISRVHSRPEVKTIHDNTFNISMTQGLPTNIISQAAVLSQDDNPTKRRTIVFDKSSNDISVTEAIPVKLLNSTGSLTERRRTLVYEDDTGSISITQAVPSNILLNENANTKEENVADNDEDHKALSSNTSDEKESKRNTIVFDDDGCDVSFTQAIPSTIMIADKILQEKRRTIIYENDTGDISVTQALPMNVILPNPEKRRTVMYNDDTGDISVTQAVPSNILLEQLQSDTNKENCEIENISTTQSLPNNTSAKDNDASRRRTIVYENDTGNISITQAIPTQVIPGFSEDKPIDASIITIKPRNRKRTTIVYDNDDGDVSMTEAIPVNIIEEAKDKRKTIVFDEDEANISVTLAISTNVFLLDKLDSAVDCVKNTTENKEVKENETNYEVYEETPNTALEPKQDERKFTADVNDYNMSMTMAISKVPSLHEIEKPGMSVTKPIPAELITCTDLSINVKEKLLDLTEVDQMVSHQPDVLVIQTSSDHSKPNLRTSTSDQAELRNIEDIYNEIFKDSSDMKVPSESFVDDDVIKSPVGDVSASNSLIHPRVEEKSNQLSLVASPNNWKVEKVFDGEEDAVMQTDAEVKSLLNTEVSMSITTIDSDTKDKNVMIRVDSSPSPSALMKGNDENSSNESMFYVTKDDDDIRGQELDHDDAKTTEPTEATYKQLPGLHIEDEDGLEAVDELQKKLEELQTVVSRSESNRLYDIDVSPDLEEVVELNEEDEPRQQKYTYKTADDTQELLNMLSNLTDNIESDNDIEHVVEKVKASEIVEHKRLSFAPNRQSIMLSREDLLSNISMAQAALQKSRLALNDTDADSTQDDTRDVSVDICNKSGRQSDCVKTLNFNDESISEESVNESPLKKTAFGETSYMHESKGRVIPTYLKDVSDGIKELMLDLVKPINNDNLPFDTGMVDKGVPMVASTQSMQIQASLATSSQVELDSDMCDPESNIEPHGATNIYKSYSLRGPVKFSGDLSEFNDPGTKDLEIETPVEQPPAVLIFDHLNPLNNVLLPPIDFKEAHKYNPIKSEEKQGAAEARRQSPLRSHPIGIHYNHTNIDNTRDFEVQTHSSKKQRVVTRPSLAQKEDTMNTTTKVTPHSSPTKVSKENIDCKGIQLRTEDESNPPVSDQSVDAIVTIFKDDEVNTTIAMKGNKELLETSSSLTLVDDAFEGKNSPVLEKNEYTNQRIRITKAHLVHIEEQATQMDSIAKLSGISIHDNCTSNSSLIKGKKRIYSPCTGKHSHRNSIEVTPKPITKMQKISITPKVQIKIPVKNESAHSMEPEKDENNSNERNAHTSKISEKKSPKPKSPKTGQTITVRQLIADCISFDSGFKHINSIGEEKILCDLKPKDSLTEVSQFDGSFTSSKDLKSMKDISSTENVESQSPTQSTMQVTSSQMDWHPDLMNVSSSSPCDSESGINVVAKIDMLPFMGSHECEWESSNSADTWSFRLLHGRLRLTARLAHRLDNATRTRVRGDTPVLDITVDTVQHERKNPVATMCVRFACETMRLMVSRALRDKCVARDIPPLLRRCAAVVRVALRWGRAMHDAKLHLAYTLDDDGNLSLKVANIPLRSVWEVSMRIELVREGGEAHPRARAVRVLPVVSDVLLPDALVRRALADTPRDWGHAPTLIWRVFRLLKNKKRDDNLLLA